MVYVIIWTCFFVKFWEFFIIFQKYWTINQLIIVKLRDCRQNLLIIFSKFKQINQFLFSLKLSQNLWSLSYRKPKATVSKETLAKNVVICRFRMFSKKSLGAPGIFLIKVYTQCSSSILLAFQNWSPLTFPISSTPIFQCFKNFNSSFAIKRRLGNSKL